MGCHSQKHSLQLSCRVPSTMLVWKLVVQALLACWVGWSQHLSKSEAGPHHNLTWLYPRIKQRAVPGIGVEIEAQLRDKNA